LELKTPEGGSKMLRVPLNKAWLKRTIRPLYGWTQQTPSAVLLDPAWDRSVPIYPGMVAMKTKGDNVTLINATGVPYGLFGEFIGGDGIDEPAARGVNATAVWVFEPGAESELLSPAFDTGASWVDPANGTIVLLHAIVDGANRGKLVPAGTTGRGTLSAKAVVRLHKVDSASKIIVGGLQVTDA
jgi:hypothetical protein